VIFNLSLDDEIFFPVSMSVLKNYNSLGLGLEILLCKTGFGSFRMVAVRRIIFAVFVVAVTSSTMVICTLDFRATI
jgi:hypothetical protein